MNQPPTKWRTLAVLQLLAFAFLVSTLGAQPVVQRKRARPAVSRPAVPQSGSVLKLLSASTPGELWQRDERVSFTAAAGRRAGRELDNPELGVGDRMSAWMAVGASRSVAFRPRLLRSALKGTPLQRSIAVLALGEMGDVGYDPLMRVLAEKSDGVKEYLVLALARCGSKTATRELFDQAALRRNPLFEEAQAYVGMVRGGAPPLRPAVAQLLQLRWEAAMRYGHVDGRRWKEVLTTGLIELPRFVNHWISAAAADLNSAVADDYLVVWAADGRADERLVGAVERLPDRLLQLWAAGEWSPDQPKTRQLVLEQLRATHTQVQGRALIEQIVSVDPMNDRARFALLAAGGDADRLWIRERTDGTLGAQRQLALAMGTAGADRWAEELELLCDPLRAVQVRADAWVARARRGDARADSRLIEVLSDETNGDYNFFVSALARFAFDAKLSAHLDVLLKRTQLDDVDRVLLLAGGIERGVSVYADPLRSAVRDRLSPIRTVAVSALRKLGVQRDRLILAELFPDSTDVRLNVELALALAEKRDPTIHGLLRSLFWRGEFAPSMLAAGILAKHYGVAALLDEIKHEGPEVSKERLRRLGLAISEWGGAQAVEALSTMKRVRPEIVEGATLGSITSAARSR